MDIRGMTIQQYIREIDNGAKMIVADNPSPKTVLLMVCGEPPKDNESKDAWTLFLASTKGAIKAQAVAGLGFFTRIHRWITVSGIYFASSEDAAKRWLVRQ
jgi:hypothetical protein